MHIKNFRTAVFAALGLFLTMFLTSCDSLPGMAGKNYSISYESENGTVPATKTVAAGYVIKAEDLPALTAEGFIFGGWYIGEKQITAESVYTVNADTKLTAKWTAEEKKTEEAEEVKNPDEKQKEEEKNPDEKKQDDKDKKDDKTDTDETETPAETEAEGEGENPTETETPEEPETPANPAIALDVSTREYPELEITYTRSGNVFTFTTSEDYARYTWFIEGELDFPVNNNTFVFDFDNVTCGSSTSSLAPVADYDEHYTVEMFRKIITGNKILVSVGVNENSASTSDFDGITSCIISIVE